MKIALPAQFQASAIFPLVWSTLGDLSELPPIVEFDFSELKFARPSGVVFLSNLSRFLTRRKCDVRFVNMRPNTEAIRFLDDALFFEQHIGEKLRQWSKPRRTTQPLQEVSHKNSHAWLRSEFMPWLSDCSGVPMGNLSDLTTCIGELFNNINDHSSYDVGCIFAQWFPKKDLVEISIADFGSGIPETVRRIEPGLSDNDAIIRAFDDGFSSQSTPRNRGVGLHLLHQNVVERFDGKISVRSQSGAVWYARHGNSLRTVPYKADGFCPGTMIDIDFRTDLIDVDEPADGLEVEWW